MNIGDLKSHCLLWTILARNQRYVELVDDRDIDTVIERSQQEGISFLTTALPSLGKALDRFHATQHWETPDGFKSQPKAILVETWNDDMVDGSYGPYREAYLPVFLGKAFKLALRGNSLAVDCIRQLTYLFYKLEVPYDEVLDRACLTRFEENDRGLLDSNIQLAEKSATSELLEGMGRLIKRILCNLDPQNIRPTHASGSTACRTKNQDKWHKLRYYPKLDAVFPYSDFFYFSATHLSDELEKLEQSETKDPRARVVLVPKDSRGPRVISCEPAELMYIQKGLQDLLYDHLEHHKITKGRVNFTRQSINRLCAKLGSKHGYYATLDLKDASDLVSLELVRRVFPARWVEALEASRSEETQLPNGEIVKLNKFAPMGSACCFPVEALVFFACAWLTQRRLGVKSPEVYVYGDDIIVPVSFSDQTMEALEAVGLKINRDKSFCSGPFRESCGGEYHLGKDVTPIKIKEILNKSHTNLVVAASLCNNIIAKFGYTNSLELIKYFEELIGYVFPRTELDIPCSLRVPPCSSNDVFLKRRFNKHLQRYEHRILTPTTRTSVLREPAWCELLRKELAKGSLTREDSNSSATIHVGDEWKLFQEWAANIRFPDCEKHLAPGEYTLDQVVRTTWSWTWLG
jgi:hypothetical protein